jgi:hypothetical protein
MGSELLSDYEEGTWTPTISVIGTTGTTNYVSRSGKYTKIGRLVNVEIFYAGINTTGSSGYFRIDGLPFTVEYGTWQSYAPYGQLNLPSSSLHYLQSGDNSTILYLEYVNNSGFYADLGPQHLIGTNPKFNLFATFIYTTA